MSDYKRLTDEKFVKAVETCNMACVYGENCIECVYFDHNSCPETVQGRLKKAIPRLAELEDKIEQGTMKEIPCNVGDTLYTNWRWQGDYMREKDAPYPIKVVFIGINNSEEMGGGLVNVVNEKGRMWQFSFNDIGKSVFLTREEAEKSLKELQNG